MDVKSFPQHGVVIDDHCKTMAHLTRIYGIWGFWDLRIKGTLLFFKYKIEDN